MNLQKTKKIKLASFRLFWQLNSNISYYLVYLFTLNFFRFLIVELFFQNDIVETKRMKEKKKRERERKRSECQIYLWIIYENNKQIFIFLYLVVQSFFVFFFLISRYRYTRWHKKNTNYYHLLLWKIHKLNY